MTGDIQGSVAVFFNPTNSRFLLPFFVSSAQGMLQIEQTVKSTHSKERRAFSRLEVIIKQDSQPRRAMNSSICVGRQPIGGWDACKSP